MRVKIDSQIALTSEPPIKKDRGNKILLIPKLATVLGVCKESDRNAVKNMVATAEAFWENINNFILNKNFVHTARQKLLQERVDEIKTKVKDTNLETVFLYWDGKRLPTLEGKEKVDRLPIIISSGEIKQLLEVPALEITPYRSVTKTNALRKLIALRRAIGTLYV